MTPATGLFVNLRGPWEPLLSLRVLILENIFWYEVLLHHLLLPMGLFFFPAFMPLSPYWCQGMPIAFLINYFLLFLHCRSFFVNLKSSMLLSASLAYVTIVTEGFDKHTISSETLKGCCCSSLWPSAPVQKETFYNLEHWRHDQVCEYPQNTCTRKSLNKSLESRRSMSHEEELATCQHIFKGVR